MRKAAFVVLLLLPRVAGGRTAAFRHGDPGALHALVRAGSREGHVPRPRNDSRSAEVACERPITLHAAEIEFVEVTIDAGGTAQTARVTLDAKAETATLTVPRQIPAGPATIRITYNGILNDKLRGFYLSKANGRSYAVTQMEATDARRAFPSFDEPIYKATFEVSLMIDQGDTAISNGAQVSDTPGPEPGKHTVSFATTPKMSTYLVAHDRRRLRLPVRRGRRHAIRVCSTPDKLGLTAVRARSRGTAARLLQQLLRHQVPVRQARHPGDSRLRRRRHGERRRDHLPRAPAARRPRARLARRAQERRGDHLARDRAPVVRQPRDDEVVGRHLAERGVRDVDREPAARRVAPGMESRAGRRGGHAVGAGPRCAAVDAGDSDRRRDA